MRTRGQRAHLALIAVCFLFSGAASLMDQVVWLRLLSLSFGNTTLATATLLAVFMGGLGLGSLLVSRWCDRLRRPLVVYALLEVGIAFFALQSPDLLGLVDHAYVALYRAGHHQPLLFAIGRAALAGCFLLPPTLLMGATLPLILRATATTGTEGRSTALFYGLNTLGAVIGTGLAGFLTIPTLGLRGTLAAAAAANLVAAVGTLIASRPRVVEPRRPLEVVDRPWLLALFFAMGATSLAFEVLWTRILVFYLGSSVYAYSLMLLAVLVGIAIGSLVAAPWADRVKSSLGALAAVELAIAATVPLQAISFQHLNDILLAVVSWIAPGGFRGVALSQLVAVLAVLILPAALMGVSFPLAVRALNRDLSGLGGDVGRVYGANTLGAVVGSLAAGFVLIPTLGTQRALFAVGLANALLGLWLTYRAVERGRLWAWLVPPLVLLPLAWLPPDALILSAGMFRLDRPGDLVYFHEDAQASVTIRRRHETLDPYLSLELNGVNVAGTSPDLYAVQKMQGHLPMLLADRPRSVVHIGFGSGGTAWAVSRHPVEEILIVEISPEVLAASDRFFPDINHGVLDDPRVQAEINDGRNFLLASPRRFSALLSDSIHPRYAGNGSLYSAEYFQLARQRLAPGGVASMWLPMYSLTPRNYGMILAAFREAFPQMAVWYETSTLNSFTIVTGKVDGPPWHRETMEGAFADPRVRDELEDLGIEGPADVLSFLVATERELAPWLDRLAPHSDDVPVVEYESGALLTRNTTWLGTFAYLLDLRSPSPPERYLELFDDEQRAEAIERYRRRGDLMRSHRDDLSANLRRLELGADAGAS